VYISYSGYKLYSQCPRAYWHRYISHTKAATPDNRVNSLYGIMVGLVFEAFYDEQMWRRKSYLADMLGYLEPCYTRMVAQETRKGDILNYEDPTANYHSPEELLVDVREAVVRGLQTIRHHRLVGPWAKAEVKLDSQVGGHILGGRADFIIRRTPPDNDLVLLDGKGSRWREKYVDRHQLLWYAMLCRCHGVGIDRLGFLYWRCEPVEAVGWVPYKPVDATGYQAVVLATLDRLEGVKGEAAYPAVVGDWCKFCLWACGSRP
jgi:hypothetical protein